MKMTDYRKPCPWCGAEVPVLLMWRKGGYVSHSYFDCAICECAVFLVVLIEVKEGMDYARIYFVADMGCGPDGDQVNMVPLPNRRPTPEQLAALTKTVIGLGGSADKAVAFGQWVLSHYDEEGNIQ